MVVVGLGYDFEFNFILAHCDIFTHVRRCQINSSGHPILFTKPNSFQIHKIEAALEYVIVNLKRSNVFSCNVCTCYFVIGNNVQTSVIIYDLVKTKPCSLNYMTFFSVEYSCKIRMSKQ